MSHHQKNKLFYQIIISLIIIKIVIFIAGYLIALAIPIIPHYYHQEFYHYYLDDRLLTNRVNFFHLWAYGDSQWYLDIAENGYNINKTNNLPDNLKLTIPEKKLAFFPLWPVAISIFNFFIKDSNISAFIAANIISLLAFYFFYKLIILYFGNKELAFKSLLLLIFFPFSIFYQLYYTESLFLLLTVLIFYFLKQKKWFACSLVAFFLSLTKAVGILVTIPVFIYIIKEALLQKKEGRLNFRKLFLKLLIIPLSGLGLFLYSWFNYLVSNDWLFFIHIQEKWTYSSLSFITNLTQNFSKLASKEFFNLKFHYFHSSQLDYIVMIIFIVLIILSYKKIPNELFFFSFVIWLTPLISKDLMSFSRHMSTCFPVFIYLASLLRKKYQFYLLLFLFEIGYSLSLLKIIRWEWVG